MVFGEHSSRCRAAVAAAEAVGEAAAAEVWWPPGGAVLDTSHSTRTHSHPTVGGRHILLVLEPLFQHMINDLPLV